VLLSYNSNAYDIPRSSTCIIHTTGVIRDGDIIEITSPVFSSINFTSGEINMSERFMVRAKVATITHEIEGCTEGTLVCFDNDVFSMYVLLQ
jgi:hypothetical protein